MKKSFAVPLFKNASAMAAELGVTRSAVSKYGDDDDIPERWALRIRHELRRKECKALEKAAQMDAEAA